MLPQLMTISWVITFSALNIFEKGLKLRNKLTLHYTIIQANIQTHNMDIILTLLIL